MAWKVDTAVTVVVRRAPRGRSTLPIPAILGAVSRLTARELIDLVLDPDSWESWDEPVDHTVHPEPYRTDLLAAAERAGTDESVITGRALMRGRPVAVLVNEFKFLAGSIGQVAAERIVRAVRRATAEGIPVLATTASGGTRMQEGTPAFVRMVDISRALMDHKAAGLPYLIYLRHPTTGGVFASWGSLGHITIAEPGALIGFLGPKVYELLNGAPFPPGIQTSDNLANRGIIDAVVMPEELPFMVDTALSILIDPPGESSRERRPAATERRHDAWDSVLLTRTPDRPGVREVLRWGTDEIIRLQGTERGERDAAMIVALARIDGEPCIVIGQDRTTQSRIKPMGPAALREARRGMKLANELGLPLVSFIDTPGAELSPDAEQGAIAGEIARCISSMSTMRVPSVSVLLGQGCGGGALALLPASRTIAAENSWLSPLPPEGASAIVFGDVDHAAQLATEQRISAFDLYESGAVHHLVPEPEGDDPEAFARALAAEVAHHLRELRGRA
ncbi:acetyl-CoA carboxylase carboxyltransferase subunit alpha/beta [Aeromicrobium tamlense]|uniref:Acetyl-CoA carboxylase carboxyltransferase subunit alpha/beta n=1 Tax=Aeromicrobium tamlense TaxID=375541 RepID=A0A8I0KMB2_9ACTN|nr:acetyl-CoA carboxylase carboxyltransferase subunit alpha/beta [Aeromicrobium tamlense]